MIFAWLPKQIENILILWFHLQQLPLVLVPPKGDENMFCAILCSEKGWPENACIPKCHARFGTFFEKETGSVCNLELTLFQSRTSWLGNQEPTSWLWLTCCDTLNNSFTSLGWKTSFEKSRLKNPKGGKLDYSFKISVCLCKCTSVFVKWMPELRALLLAFLAEKGASGKGLVK